MVFMRAAIGNCVANTRLISRDVPEKFTPLLSFPATSTRHLRPFVGFHQAAMRNSRLDIGIIVGPFEKIIKLLARRLRSDIASASGEFFFYIVPVIAPGRTGRR
jgi:hypothetical protein